MDCSIASVKSKVKEDKEQTIFSDFVRHRPMAFERFWGTRRISHRNTEIRGHPQKLPERQGDW